MDVKYVRDTYLADRYSVNRCTIWRWLAKGLLPEPIVIGGSTRWKLSDIEAFEEQRDGLV